MDFTHIKRLFNRETDRAVSPVIGVILMVAITVILAAVVGTFVLGLGSGIQSTPQVSFSFDYTDNTDTADNDTLNVNHGGGDTIEASAVSASVQDAYNGNINTEVTTSSVDLFINTDQVSAGNRDEINASRMGLGAGDDLILNESTVRVVFEQSDNTAILAKWTGPDA